mmetsp:Transcript_1255/g.2918  ORF Transcript_1255/g.2918 Transcript_1255/m.2918 type:complete len:115 (-) Transcript_1255:382-726(-)
MGEAERVGEEKKSLAGGAPGVAMGTDDEAVVCRIGVVDAAGFFPFPNPKRSSSPPAPLEPKDEPRCAIIPAPPPAAPGDVLGALLLICQKGSPLPLVDALDETPTSIAPDFLPA